MTNLLSIKNVSKFFFQNNRKYCVLSDISFQFKLSNSYAITGASGVGKSTLMHIIAGTDTPSSGQVFWGVENINQFTIQQKKIFWNQKLGLVFQQPCLIDELTVLENVMLKGLIGGYHRKDVQEQAQTILAQVGLTDRIDFFPAVLSKGEQQRVAIARALINKPQLILADEPTGSLDRNTGMQVVDILTSLQKKYQIGLVLSTHDEYVYRTMDNILQLSDAKLNLIDDNCG